MAGARSHALLLGAVLLAAPLPAQEGPDAVAVERAVQRGVGWLLRVQELDGHWRGNSFKRYPGGATALAVYALLRSGLAPGHPAVRLGVAAMDAACERCDFGGRGAGAKVYTASVMLMAYEALGPTRPRERVAELARFLLDSAQGSRWSYPVGETDLSNTQYALMGLRAAASCGFRVPLALHQRVAKGLLQAQDAYGGFGYRIGRGPTSSMTCAGLTGLLVCQEALRSRRAAPALRGRMRAGVRNGIMWLGNHWSVERNVTPAKEPPKYDRWLFYYLYGLERVGALTGEEVLAGHPWYAEGAAFLLDRQGKAGNWNAPGYKENDLNTCFALLFLVRGTRKSGPVKRPAAALAAEQDAPVVIGCNDANPLVAWVRRVRPEALGDDRVASVTWKVDGREVGVVDASAEAGRNGTFTLQHEFRKNELHQVRAVARLASSGRELASNVIEVAVNDVAEPWHEEGLADSGRNLVDPEEVEVTASSHYDGGWRPANACDGTYVTSWLSAKDDPRPWLRVVLRSPVRASKLKFACARPWAWPGQDRRYARPKDVEVVVDGRALRLELDDVVQRKHTVSFGSRPVRSVTIRVLSLHPGRKHETCVGLRELELFR